MNGETPHPLNVLLDPLSIIEVLLLYGLFLDLLENTQLRHNLRVQTIEVSGCGDALIGAFALRGALGQGIAWRSCLGHRI